MLASALASVVLPVPGHVLEQQVALGEQAGQRQPDDVALAEHGQLDVLGHRLEGLPEPGGAVAADAHASHRRRGSAPREGVQERWSRTKLDSSVMGWATSTVRACALSVSARLGSKYPAFL